MARDPEVERSVKRLGYRMIPATVAGMILLRADLIANQCSNCLAGLGIYAVASTFSELSTVLVRQYVDARTPRWRARFDRGSPPGSAPIHRIRLQ